MRSARSALMTAALAMSDHAVTAAVEQSRQLVVVVNDLARVMPAVLDQAEKEATRILRHAGVGVEWHAEPAGIWPAPGANDRSPSGSFLIRLVVLPKFLGAPAARSRVLMGATVAARRACDGVIYVYQAEVIELANAHGISPWLAIGSVVAHEIGHALLNRGHSAEGLMRAPWAANDWERASLGLLLFSRDEAAAILTTMASCHAGQ
jgi:hypothetical protein